VNGAILPAIGAGERVVAFAHDEGSHFRPYAVSTRAEPDGDGFRLTGEKTFVLDGHVADDFIVVARSAGEPEGRAGLTLLLVPSQAPGIEITRLQMVDSRNAARVRFAATPARTIIGRPGAGRTCSTRCSIGLPSAYRPKCWGASKRSSIGRSPI
jgi:alkylation response protein AidB-like acyl-CoA dehydrogenase